MLQSVWIVSGVVLEADVPLDGWSGKVHSPEYGYKHTTLLVLNKGMNDNFWRFALALNFYLGVGLWKISIPASFWWRTDTLLQLSECLETLDCLIHWTKTIDLSGAKKLRRVMRIFPECSQYFPILNGRRWI